MTATLWQFWEGKTPPPVINLCLQSVARHNPTTRVVNYQTLRELGAEEVVDFCQGLPFPQQSDLVRFWLLHFFGGCWVDTDTVALAPLDWLDFIEAEPVELVGTCHPRGWQNNRLVASPFGATKGSPLMLQAFRQCLKRLERIKRGERVPYGATSVGVLSSIYQQHKRNPNVHRFAHWKYHRTPWYFARRVFNRRAHPRRHELGGEFNPNAQLYHLSNPIPDYFKGQTEEQILKGNSFLSFLLQKAFGLGPAVMGRTREICKRIHSSGMHGVEIGVFGGINLRQLIQQKPHITVTGVDPWAYVDPSYQKTKDHQAFYTEAQWEHTYQRACRFTKFADHRIRLLRMTSQEALAHFEDRSVDFVFIDGNHSEEAVTLDLQWARKVKPGGWIGGHDYNQPKNKKGLYGVNRAVDRFVSENNLTLENGVDTTWFVYL